MSKKENTATINHSRPDNQATSRFPNWLLITLIIFACLMILWQMLICGGVSGIGDTHTYLKAWERLKTFHPDLMRPPVYPILIGTIFDLFGQTVGIVILFAVQWAVWVAGCRCTWLILRYFNVNQPWCNVTIFLMMALPGTWVLNNLAQTDGMSSGLTPMLVWQIIRYQQSKETKWILYGGALLFCLIYLKPQFIYIIPIWGIAWIAVTRKISRQLIWSISILCLATGSIFFYKWSLWHCYRFEGGISTVSAINNYYSLRMAGLIHPDEITDEYAREKLRPYLEADPGTDLPDHYLYWSEHFLVGDKATDQIWRHAYKLHTAEANAFILHRIPQSLNYSIFFSRGHARPYDTEVHRAYYKIDGSEPPSANFDFNGYDIVYGKKLFKIHSAYPWCLIYPLYDIAVIPFWAAWLTIILFTGIYIRQWICQREFPVTAFMLASLLVGCYITVFIGAPCDWGRLVTPVCMLLFAAATVTVSKILKSMSGFLNSRAHETCC